MKTTLKNCLMTITVAASLISATSIATLYSTSVNAAYSRYVCRWVPGHWRHGHWVPGHRVCWWRTVGRNCRWIPGHWRHGRWIPGRRICRW